jgi:hypothetical protein
VQNTSTGLLLTLRAVANSSNAYGTDIPVLQVLVEYQTSTNTFSAANPPLLVSHPSLQANGFI